MTADDVVDLGAPELAASGPAMAYAERFGQAFSWGRPRASKPRPEAEAFDHRNVLAAELAEYDHYRHTKMKTPA